MFILRTLFPPKKSCKMQKHLNFFFFIFRIVIKFYRNISSHTHYSYRVVEHSLEKPHKKEARSEVKFAED